MLVFLLKTIAWVIQRLSWSACEKFAQFLAWLLFDLIKIRRDVVERNLKFCFGKEKTQEQLTILARNTYRHFALLLLELMRLPKIKMEEQRPFFNVYGEEIFRREVAKGKGIVFSTGHFGNWEIAGTIMALQKYDCYAYARPLHNRKVDSWLNNIRKAHGLQIISSKYSIRPVVNALKEGKLVAFVVDQSASTNSIELPFFGHPARCFEGPAFCAYKSGAPVIPCYFIRRDGQYYDIHIEKPLYPNQEAPEREEILRLTKFMQESLQQRIREYPDQYFWFHRRWGKPGPPLPETHP